MNALLHGSRENRPTAANRLCQGAIIFDVEATFTGDPALLPQSGAELRRMVELLACPEDLPAVRHTRFVGAQLTEASATSRTFSLGFLLLKRRGKSRSERVTDHEIRKQLRQALKAGWFRLRRNTDVALGKVSVGEVLRLPLSALNRMQRLFVGGGACLGSRSLEREPGRKLAQRKPTQAVVGLARDMLGYEEQRTEPYWL
jgi:hypothetical protein